MLKVLVKIVNTTAAVYVLYMAGATVYNMGKEAGRKEVGTYQTVDNGSAVDSKNVNGAQFKVVDGVLYERVK